MKINYVDAYSRYHHKPVTNDNPFPSNNGFLYTGYAFLLGLNVILQNVKVCFIDCLTEWGYNRHPKSTDTIPASSHDEIVGMFMILSTVECRGMIRKYESQFWQVCNLPGFKPLKWYRLNPFKVAWNFWKLSREENPRTATPKYPYIWPIIFGHARQHVYFYKRCALVPPGLRDSIVFFFASLFTSFFGSNSSKVMLGFKFMKLLEKGELKKTEKILLSVFDKRVDFGVEVATYFPKGHPIPRAILGLKDE